MGVAETGAGSPADRLLAVSAAPPLWTALLADFADLEAQLQRVLIDFPRVPPVLCGDLNCDLLKDPSFPARQHLTSFLSDYALDQLVTAPTFTSGSLLDVCMMNSRELVRESHVKHCHFSPHKFINVTVQVHVPKVRQKPAVILTRSFRRLDFAALNHDLLDVDWENVFAARTVGDQWDAFLSSFLPVIDAHAPLRRVTIRNPTAPPVSAATRDLMSQRRDALQRLGRKSTAYKDLNRSVRVATGVRRCIGTSMRGDPTKCGNVSGLWWLGRRMERIFSPTYLQMSLTHSSCLLDLELPPISKLKMQPPI